MKGCLLNFIRIWKPTIPKLALTLLALVASAYARYAIQAAKIVDLWSWGFPLAFYEMWGPCTPEPLCRAFELRPLLVDLLFWYVAIVLLVASFGAIRWMVADIVAE